jgi:hypothetical protein
MAILDERTEFADAFSVAVAASTIIVGDVIDLVGAATPLGFDIGNGEQVYLVIQTETEIVTGGVAGTIQFRLTSDSTANLATSPTTHFETKAFVTDDSAANDNELNAGGIIAAVALPLEGVLYERFLGILAVVATTTITAGTVNAYLTKNPSKWKAYPNAIGA